MNNLLIHKTHYELVKDLIQQKKLFHLCDFQTFINNVNPYCGSDPSYEEFAKSPFLKHVTESLKSPSEASVFANVLYHLYSLYQHHERIYYVCPKLAVDLSQTELNVDTRFLKSPFPELYIQIDPGLYYLSDAGGEYPIRGFYVNLREEGGTKLIRIMAAALKKPSLDNPDNDVLFYFRVPLGPGKVKDQVQKYIDESVTTNEKELQTFGGYHNMNHIKELFSFVFNILLYITSKDADILSRLPMNAKISQLKNKAKIKKVLQRQSKTCQLPVLVVGPNVISNYSIEKIKNAGGVGKWKLNEKIYVEGHWRIQWYGPRNASRAELIYVKPYEKGPDMAEVISRRYQVGIG